MNKIGLLFPGQGSQYAGMGKEFYDNFSQARALFDKANAVLGFDLTKIMFEGPEEVLRQTQYTQPAIFAASGAFFEVFSKAIGLSASSCLCAGHSLGEYSALCSSGVFSFEDGMNLVKKRGEFIQLAAEKNPGAMAAIMGLEPGKVEQACKEASSEGVCEPANFNTKEQTVISGNVRAVELACLKAKEKGALKTVMLNVSGAFHSSLMKEASALMAQELTKYNFVDPVYPVITNCDALPTTVAGQIKDKLVRQISSPVKWVDSINKMIEFGADIFIEIGPKNVLSGLLRRIDRTKKCLNIEDQKTLDSTLKEIMSIQRS
jgi:[acyl-carrier-protein] S-malonyltransferase